MVGCATAVTEEPSAWTAARALLWVKLWASFMVVATSFP